eukprot:3761981-Rhodomonas_salina.1
MGEQARGRTPRAPSRLGCLSSVIAAASRTKHLLSVMSRQSQRQASSVKRQSQRQESESRVRVSVKSQRQESESASR